MMDELIGLVIRIVITGTALCLYAQVHYFRVTRKFKKREINYLSKDGFGLGLLTAAMLEVARMIIQ